MIAIGITDHIEGPLDRNSREIFDEVADLVRLADELGVRYAWFAEHHDHVHDGHLPVPLLLAMHLVPQTKQIQLGCAVICLSLHHPLDVAEHVAVADALTGGRLSIGFGSAATPEEGALFGAPDLPEREKHDRFAESLQIIRAVVSGEKLPPFLRYFPVPVHRARLLPKPSDDFLSRCWVAANSIGAARIAGAFNFNILLSHLRTVDQYRQLIDAYRAEGGKRLVAANRPIFVGPNHHAAREMIEPTLRALWRQFQVDGKIPHTLSEPSSVDDLADHPINFIVGGPMTVARDIRRLHADVPFDVLNCEFRWAGLSHEQVRESMQLFMTEVAPGICS